MDRKGTWETFCGVVGSSSNWAILHLSHGCSGSSFIHLSGKSIVTRPVQLNHVCAGAVLPVASMYWLLLQCTPAFERAHWQSRRDIVLSSGGHLSRYGRYKSNSALNNELESLRWPLRKNETLSIFHAFSTGLISMLLMHWVVAMWAKRKVEDNKASCILN